MAWTVGSAQEEAAFEQSTPLLQRTSGRVGLGLLALAVILSLFGQSWALWTFGLIAGGYLLYLGWRGYQEAIPPKGGPCFAISTIKKEGPVEIVARIVPPKRALLSPLTSYKCTYFKYKVTLLNEDGGEKEVLDQGEELSDFWLKDVTGRIWVESAGIDIKMKKQLDADLRTYDQTPRPIRDRFKRLEIEAFESPGVRKPIRIEELRLDPGDNVLVKGEVYRREDGALGIHKGAGTFSVERWEKPTFIPMPARGTKLNLALGATLVVVSALALAVF